MRRELGGLRGQVVEGLGGVTSGVYKNSGGYGRSPPGKYSNCINHHKNIIVHLSKCGTDVQTDNVVSCDWRMSP